MNGVNQSTENPWTPGRVALATLIVAGVALGFWLILYFHELVLALFAGIVLATALRWPIRFLEGRGINRTKSVLATYASVGIVSLGLIGVALPLIAEQVSHLVDDFPAIYSQARENLSLSSGELPRRLADYLPEKVPRWEEWGTMPAGDDAMAYAAAGVRTMGLLIAAMLFAFYWSLQEERSTHAVLVFVPEENRKAARDIIEAGQTKLGGYVRGQGILCAAIAVMASVTYLVMGLPYAIPLALVAGVLEAVPVVGPTLGAVPAVIVAMSLGGNTVFYVIAATVVMQLLENHLLQPRVMDHAVGVNPIVSLLALAAFSALFGLGGAILAVPMAALLQLILERFWLSREATAPVTPQGRDYPNVLLREVRILAQDVRMHLRQDAAADDPAIDQLQDSIEAIARELEATLGQHTGELEPAAPALQARTA